MEQTQCTMPGCGGKHYGRGLCSKHYQRIHRGENMGKCIIDGCGNSASVKNLCWKHYTREYRGVN